MLKVAILISGGGTNLQALIDACQEDDFPAEIVCVISNKEEAYGLKRAEISNIKTCIINHKDYNSREEFDAEMDRNILDSGAEFICLAGFMRLLSKWFTEKWAGKMINIHPSLLPAFKGANAHRDVLASGVKVSGCTVHFVVPKMDAGPIIMQSTVPVYDHDTIGSLSERILVEEHKCYPSSLKLIAEERVVINDGKVVISD